MHAETHPIFHTIADWSGTDWGQVQEHSLEWGSGSLILARSGKQMVGVAAYGLFLFPDSQGYTRFPVGYVKFISDGKLPTEIHFCPAASVRWKYGTMVLMVNHVKTASSSCPVILKMLVQRKAILTVENVLLEGVKCHKQMSMQKDFTFPAHWQALFHCHSGWGNAKPCQVPSLPSLAHASGVQATRCCWNNIEPFVSGPTSTTCRLDDESLYLLALSKSSGEKQEEAVLCPVLCLSARENSPYS